MSAPDLTGLLYLPGELVISPTDLTIAFPHGGTRIGLLRDIVIRPGQANTVVRTEEFGAEVVEIIEGGREWILAAALRGYDDDAIRRVFPTTAVGAETGRRVITDGGDARAGARGSARSVPLLFSPDDTGRRPAILFHRAIPMVSESAALTLDLDMEGMIGVVFRAIRHGTSARLVSVGHLRDISGRLEAP